MSMRKFYTKKRGKSLASLAQQVEVAKFHVISGDSNWRVVSEGNVKAIKAFSTMEQAVTFAKVIAEKRTGEVVVHEDSGQIKDRITFTVAH
ncbi:MAG TPA: hypothetical protein DIU05_01525 [Bacteroidetes bacterium]|jgi:hypothetical protein|nr:hypothetical protein [Bacteroidota bacterium]